MRINHVIIIAIAGLFLSPAGLFAQKDFTNCSAIFINHSMLVDDYSPKGKCVIPANAGGTLSLYPVILDDGKGREGGNNIPFKIAIRDGNTKTLTLFSEETYREVPVDTVLAQCRPGDAIVLITMEREWALPHSEILVE